MDRNIGLDLLRGASILYIVGFWHLLEYTEAVAGHDNQLTSMLTKIVLGVFVFVSGYFIGRKKIGLARGSLWRFYQQRLLRIYPLYLLAVALFAGLDGWSLAVTLKAALSVSVFAAPAPRTLWFVSMLLFFYLISPVLVAACRAGPAGHLAKWAWFAAMTLGLLAYEFATGLLDSRVLVYFPAFFLGIYAATREAAGLRRRRVPLVLPSLSAAGYLLVSGHIPSQFEIPSSMTLVSIWAPFLFLLLKDMPITSRTAGLAIFYLSYASYCMYLFHRPLIDVLMKVYFPGSLLFQLAYLLLFCLPLITLFSFFLQKLYDAAIGLLARRSRASRESALPG